MLRIATSADADRLITLAESFLAQTFYGAILPNTNPDRLRTVIHLLLDPAFGVIFVEEDGARLVGMLGLARAEHPLTGQAFADEIAWWVEPEHRGRRGLALLAAAEAWAVEQGCAFLRMVAPAGSPLGPVYERRGYQGIEAAYLKPLSRAA